MAPGEVPAHAAPSSSARGLTAAEARSRLSSGLGNGYTAPTSRPILLILRSNVLTLFNAIVGGAFLLLLVLGYWRDALFGVFVIANIAIGVAQEVRAKRTLDRLAVLSSPGSRVLRDGRATDVPIAEVVRDDVLVLSPGDQVPADAIVLEANGLGVDESLVTGEAEPAHAEPGRELLSGSFVAAGHALARVVRVGAGSYANRIAAEARSFELVASELRSSLTRTVRWISWILAPVGALVVNGQMQAAGGWGTALASDGWQDAIVRSVAAIVSMVPQGLVFMTSVALAVGALTLARRRVLVQELPAVEMLARVDALCFDKTGTLTDGTLELTDVETLASPSGWESALAWFGAEHGANVTARALAERFPDPPTGRPERIVGFSSSFKWSAVSFGDGTAIGSWLLGAPDILLEPGSEPRLRADRAARDGFRTLALAHRVAPMTRGEQEAGTRPGGHAPVALLFLRERIRPDAHDAVAYLREQGVRLWVLSGDHPATAAATARSCGISTEEGLDARGLPEDSTELGEILDSHAVFGRVTPEQKRQLVGALQSRGHVVAMTGDGVNDALALKRADLGIAMGSGSAATRAVSHLVLLDGQFGELPRVVAEGRRVIANVERLSKLFLTKTVYAMVFAVLFGAILGPFPFLPRQLSAVDGLTIGLPALVLALLPHAPRYRAGFLGRAARFCLPAGAVVAAAVAAVVLVLRGSGLDDAEPSAAVITLTLAALWVLVILSRPLDAGRLLLLVAMYAGLVLVLVFPPTAGFFSVGVPAVGPLLIAIAGGIGASIVIEVVVRVLKPGR